LFVAISISFSYEAVVFSGTSRCGVVHYFPVCYFYCMGSCIFVIECQFSLKVSLQLFYAQFDPLIGLITLGYDFVLNILQYILALQFDSLRIVLMYLCMLFAWVALMIFMERILLCLSIYSFFISVNITITQFHICVHWLHLIYGTTMQHISALTEPPSGDTIYKVIKILICNSYGSILQNLVSIVKRLKI
jgi:hypothetical protein